jgi:hypothetical protein
MGAGDAEQDKRDQSQRQSQGEFLIESNSNVFYNLINISSNSHI